MICELDFSWEEKVKLSANDVCKSFLTNILSLRKGIAPQDTVERECMIHPRKLAVFS